MREASSQLMRIIRGPRSQRKLSKLLGYSGNPVEHWEAGRSFPTASVALRAGELAKLDVRAAAAGLCPHAVNPMPNTDPGGVANWMRIARAGMKLVELGRRMNRRPLVVGRWLRGVSQPKLPEFLEFVEATTKSAARFVGDLVPIEKVPALQAEQAKRELHRKVVQTRPELSAYRMALQTEDYENLPSHKDGWLSDLFGITLEEEQEALAKMVEAAMIEFREGKVVAKKDISVFETTEGPAMHKSRYWLEKALQRTDDKQKGDLFGHVLASMAHVDREAARKVMLEAFHKIRNIANTSKARETVSLFNVQWIDWKV